MTEVCVDDEYDEVSDDVSDVSSLTTSKPTSANNNDDVNDDMRMSLLANHQIRGKNDVTVETRIQGPILRNPFCPYQWLSFYQCGWNKPRLIFVYFRSFHNTNVA